MGLKQSSIDPNARLLYALAEELKLPFMQVARNAELGQITKSIDHYKNIETTADATIKLLDSYVLSTQTLIQQVPLELSPMPVTSILYEVGQQLDRLTKLYNAKVDIVVEGKCGLVMAHKEALFAAISSLAYTFICASQQQTQVTLFARKEDNRIIAGVLSSQSTINKKSLELARKLYGNARQPYPSVTHNQGAGLYVADSLFGAMESDLYFSRLGKSRGFLAPFQLSRQLALL
jgi:hypothetical protein